MEVARIEENTISDEINEDVNGIELDDFFWSLPKQTDPLFQQKITGDKMFSVLASGPNEPVPKPREFYNPQKLIHRMMTHYHKVFVMWSPGTGKSGISGFAEQLRRDTLGAVTEYVNEYITSHKTYIKRVVYLVKNDTLMEQIKNDIVCKFSAPETYSTEKILKSEPNSTSRKSHITREINKYYQVETHTKFAKKLYTMKYTEKDFEREYSGTLFIIDEVHNLRIESSISHDDETWSVNMRKNNENTKIKQQSVIYDTYWKLLHSVKRSKIILMSATPMINSAVEDGFIMNLILPKNIIDNQGNIIERNQMPVLRKDESFYIKSTKEDFRKYYNGYISYIGQSSTFAVPNPIGETVGEDYTFRIKNNETGIVSEYKIKPKLKIYPLRMADKIIMPDGSVIPGQEEVYQQVSNKLKDSAFRLHERQLSNFMFPDGTYGMKGVKRWIKGFDVNITEEKKKEITYYEPKESLIPWITNSAYFSKLSIKFWKTVELTDEAKGNVFIFSPFKIGGGAFLLGMCLRYNKGYEQFTETSSLLINTGEGNKTDLCFDTSGFVDDQSDQPSIHANIARIRQDFKKKKRYAIITSNMPNNAIRVILETYNSYDNRYGEYIKCLIVTPIAREGINVSNAIRYIPLGPNWNPGLEIQAKNRIFRATSHVYLMDDIKKKLISEGKDPALAEIIVEIYNLASIKDMGLGFTADTEMYRISEQKNIQFKYIESIKHYYAFDGQINASRNKISKSRDPYSEYFSSDDYVNLPPLNINTNGYDNLYSDDDVKIVIGYIKNIFSNTFSLSFDEIEIVLQKYPKKYPLSYTIKALNRIIQDKSVIIDKYGYYVYLKEDGDQFYIIKNYLLTDKLTSHNTYIMDYYSLNLISTLNKEINEYISETKLDENNSLEKILKNTLITDPIFMRTFNKLSNDNKIKMFETATYNMIVKLDTKPSEVDDFIYNIYTSEKNKYFFSIYEPTGLIIRTSEALSMVGKGRGRKRNIGNIPTLSDLKIIVPVIPTPGSPGVSNEVVYIHILYGMSSLEKTYSASSNIAKYRGRLRILKKSDNSPWRDLSTYETLVYNDIINKIISSKLDKFVSLPFYGIINGDKFWIRDKMNEVSNPTGQTKKRGRIVRSYDVIYLNRFMWELKIPIADIQSLLNITPIQLADIPFQEKFNMLYNVYRIKVDIPSDPLSNFTAERINYYYDLSNLKLSKDKYAIVLKYYLNLRGWIYHE